MNPEAPVRARTQFDAWRAAVSRNAWQQDPHLQSLVEVHGYSSCVEALDSYGELVSDQLDQWARQSNRDENLPRLRRFDGQGRRIEQVEFHPSYHQLGRAFYGTGAMARYATPGREFETLALVYLNAQNGEAGHCCPSACTAGLIKILQASDAGVDDWLPRLLDPDYDSHFHGAQFLTEVQGGSDVGANALEARRDASGQWRLYGEKWFCSVIDAHLFLVTARPAGNPTGTRGLRAFAVPRTVDGGVNEFHIRRLKYKLGTRSMASAELDFRGARAVPVGDFRTTVEVVLNTSRLYNAICSSGMMQRAWREAFAYAQTREAFGRPILGFPTVARIVSRLQVEAYCARALTFLLASLSDDLATGKAGPEEASAFRMWVNLNKFWTSDSCTSAIRDAIEVLGGNGAIEEFSVLPRLLRDSIVCEAWEGGHNVLCAQVLKDSTKLGTHHAAFQWLESMGPSPELTEAREIWDALLDAPMDQQAALVRDVAEQLRLRVQVHVLRAEGAHAASSPLLPSIIDAACSYIQPWDAQTFLQRASTAEAVLKASS